MPAIFCMAGIFMLSSQPKLPTDQIFIFGISIEDINYYDKLGHFTAYFILGCSVWFSLSDKRLNNWKLKTTFVVSLLYGISDEIHQIFVVGRSFELLDLFADGLGALTAGKLISYFTGGDRFGKG
ncbi:MAG: VanZ family protein [Armatimonadota bacterium]